MKKNGKAVLAMGGMWAKRVLIRFMLYPYSSAPPRPINAPPRCTDISLLPKKVGARRKIAPKIPDATPNMPFLLMGLLKIRVPITSVNTGVNAFKIPESPEGIKVPAVENKKAGMAFPSNPVRKRKK